MGYAEGNKARDRSHDLTTIVELSCECLEIDVMKWQQRLCVRPCRPPGWRPVL